MSRLPTFSDDDQSPWSAALSTANTPEEPSVASALEKEKVIKDVLTLRDGLRGLMVRMTEVEGEIEQLGRDNEMLAVYIDNLYVHYLCCGKG